MPALVLATLEPLLPIDTDATGAVALEDLDGDGDLDLFFVNAGSQDRLLLNDGSGQFTDVTATHLPPDLAATVAVACCDVDEDGDVDLVVGDLSRCRVYLNAGDARFVDAPSFAAGATTFRLVLREDLDRDGDADVLFARSVPSGGLRLYLNRLRQLEAPFVPRVGSDYLIEAYALGGPGPQPDLAAPLLSPSLGATPLPPWGVFGLDPTQLAALPPFPIAVPEGVGSLTLPIPSNPALVGAPFFVQALLVGAGSARFTNVVADTMFR
ncbi:MAG: VCBS repeat-containing protein [Planctomycetota bacterium]